MYNGIGQQTPVRLRYLWLRPKNKFFVKPKTNKVVIVDGGKGFKCGGGAALNKDILGHDRKRKTQLKLLVLEEKLADLGHTNAEIADKLEEDRRTLDGTAKDFGGSTAIIALQRVTPLENLQNREKSLGNWLLFPKRLPKYFGFALWDMLRGREVLATP